MTTTTRNEAAERLREFGRTVPMPDPVFREAFLNNVDGALAAERRATVEQVRALLHDRYRIDAEAGATIEEWDSILDELVAAR